MVHYTTLGRGHGNDEQCHSRRLLLLVRLEAINSFCQFDYEKAALEKFPTVLWGGNVGVKYCPDR